MENHRTGLLATKLKYDSHAALQGWTKPSLKASRWPNCFHSLAAAFANCYWKFFRVLQKTRRTCLFLCTCNLVLLRLWFVYLLVSQLIAFLFKKLYILSFCTVLPAAKPPTPFSKSGGFGRICGQNGCYALSLSRFRTSMTETSTHGLPQVLMDADPGLRRRFSMVLQLEDYSPEELADICHLAYANAFEMMEQSGSLIQT